MRLIAFIIFIISFSRLGAGAEITPPLAAALAQLRTQSVVCADFRQSKNLTLLSKPLLSRGRIVFRRGDGVLWKVLNPISGTVVLRKTSMVLLDETGGRQVVEYSKNPIFGSLSQTLVAVIAGDLNELGESFKVGSESLDDRRWRLTLRPGRAEIARLVRNITIEGRDFADIIRIEETSGDSTEIIFSAVENGCVITETEKLNLAR